MVEPGVGEATGSVGKNVPHSGVDVQTCDMVNFGQAVPTACCLHRFDATHYIPGVTVPLRVHVAPLAIHVTLRRGADGWSASRPVVDGDVRGALGTLLADVPRTRWLPRPSVVAVVGAHASRVKHLRGLPDV